MKQAVLDILRAERELTKVYPPPVPTSVVCSGTCGRRVDPRASDHLVGYWCSSCWADEKERLRPKDDD